MNIFVTGATGFLGYHFVNVAVNNGHSILCLRRSTSKSLFEPIVEATVQWVSMDDKKFVEIVRTFQPDVLLHAAWEGVRGRDRNNALIQQNNLKFSRELFSLYPYKQIISLGSQAEYGYYSRPVSEDHTLHPLTEYAKAKVKCSQDLKDYCDSHHIEWQWIRIFTVFGEKQTGGLIKTAIDKCLSNEKFFPTTKGEQLYSYLYSFDFAQALCRVLGSKGKSGIYNLSQTNCLYSNREVLEKIKRLTGSDIELQFGAIPYPENQIMWMDGYVSKFTEAFGNIPLTDFDKALRNIIGSLANS